ncbi:MAG: hypothetical protein VXW22_12735, partial [Pseudomonadota bacterium]|nr:hypothetical protein [Pseudomonadota bacterium]
MSSFSEMFRVAGAIMDGGDIGREEGYARYMDRMRREIADDEMSDYRKDRAFNKRAEEIDNEDRYSRMFGGKGLVDKGTSDAVRDTMRAESEPKTYTDDRGHLKPQSERPDAPADPAPAQGRSPADAFISRGGTYEGDIELYQSYTERAQAAHQAGDMDGFNIYSQKADAVKQKLDQESRARQQASLDYFLKDMAPTAPIG